ncbi:cell death-inducing p53-target protein 1-like [Girardinichthys multiradiatus]|uniref:cell death-inducing p53-target protein 1-like n=1 Tax=Girardinichthys multiradiatus TaxID=208333 RepID=UPI001FAE3EB3|nr:cell death-inducing p53-target protein 1-like [Girardinichthys multiradiatus]
MELLSKVDESLPTPPPYYLSGGVSEQSVRVYQISPSFNPSTSFVPSLAAPNNSWGTIVSYKAEMSRAPALMTCSFCQTQVITEVTFQVGTFAWLMCFLFVLCGLILGCCLIPFFVNHFKDACHSCPCCQHVLHVQRRSCFER